MKHDSLIRKIFGQFDKGGDGAFYGKWMWIYFWMNFVFIIPSGLMELELQAPELAALGGVLNTLLCLFNACLLLILGLREDRFIKSGLLYFVCTIVGYVVSVLNLELVTGFWSTAASVLELIAEYFFFFGCAVILETVNPELSVKWKKLWKWYLAIHVCAIPGLVASVALLATQMVVLGSLTTLILGMAVIVVTILVIVYEYKTAQTFHNFQKS